MKQGALGIKIMVGGRLGGAEMSRDVWLRDGLRKKMLLSFPNFGRGEKLFQRLINEA